MALAIRRDARFPAVVRRLIIVRSPSGTPILSSLRWVPASTLFNNLRIPRPLLLAPHPAALLIFLFGRRFLMLLGRAGVTVSAEAVLRLFWWGRGARGATLCAGCGIVDVPCPCMARPCTCMPHSCPTACPHRVRVPPPARLLSPLCASTATGKLKAAPLPGPVGRFFLCCECAVTVL